MKFWKHKNQLPFDMANLILATLLQEIHIPPPQKLKSYQLTFQDFFWARAIMWLSLQEAKLPASPRKTPYLTHGSLLQEWQYIKSSMCPHWAVPLSREPRIVPISSPMKLNTPLNYCFLCFLVLTAKCTPNEQLCNQLKFIYKEFTTAWGNVHKNVKWKSSN